MHLTEAQCIPLYHLKKILFLLLKTLVVFSSIQTSYKINRVIFKNNDFAELFFTCIYSVLALYNIISYYLYVRTIIKGVNLCLRIVNTRTWLIPKNIALQSSFNIVHYVKRARVMFKASNKRWVIDFPKSRGF